MKIKLNFQDKKLEADLSKPIDISLSLNNGTNNVNAYYLPNPEFKTFRAEGFVGSMNEGGPCNVNNLFLSPHGNGTHTECVGHISKEPYTINQCLKEFHFIAQLISVQPRPLPNTDRVIILDEIKEKFIPDNEIKALVIRTLPNDDFKKTKNYSGKNAPYLHSSAAKLIADSGIEHLLLDLPSVDKENDGGVLAAHHEFWKYPAATRVNCSITELIYVPGNIADGIYLLNIQIASLESDASPSKILLFELKQK